MGEKFDSITAYGGAYSGTITVEYGIFTIAKDAACTVTGAPRHWRRATLPRPGGGTFPTVMLVPATVHTSVEVGPQRNDGGILDRDLLSVAFWEQLWVSAHTASVDPDGSGPKKAVLGTWVEDSPGSDTFTITTAPYVVRLALGERENPPR